MEAKLTPVQFEVYDLIRNSLRETGRMPSYRELTEARGLRNLKGTSRIVKILERQGLVELSGGVDADGLTVRQREILDYIILTYREEGIPPTMKEVQNKFDFSSINAVTCHVVALRKKGFLEDRPSGRIGKMKSHRLVPVVPPGHCKCCGRPM